MVTVGVLLSSGQCIDRVMRLVEWGGVGVYCLFQVLTECVIELCVVLVLVYCSLYVQ